MLSGPFRLHKDFMISGRLSLPPMSTFQDHSVVSAHRSRRDMLVERSQASARKAERTHSPHELTESYCSYACLEIQEVRSVLKPFFRWVCPCRAHDGGLFDAFDRYQYPWTDVFPLSLGAQRSGAGRGRLCTGSLSIRRSCWMGESAELERGTICCSVGCRRGELTYNRLASRVISSFTSQHSGPFAGSWFSVVA